MSKLSVVVIGACFVTTWSVTPVGEARAEHKRARSTVTFEAPSGAVAETSAAVDPADTDHLIVAADPYLDPVRIFVRQSDDGGRTWSKPVFVVPPGFDKSYDPTLSVLPDGRVLLVGGASRVGAPYCQPDSSIFVADITKGRPRFSFVQRTRPSTYVDRPFMVSDPDSGRVYTAWTESYGVGAECRAAPTSSRVMFAWSADGESFAPPIRLPSSGFPAPFGSSIAVDATGGVHVAVRERDPTRGDRIVTVTSVDAGVSFSKPDVVASTPGFPSSLSGLGGFVSGTPVIGFDETGGWLAWPALTPDGSRIDIAKRRPSGRWFVDDSLERSGAYELFPNISFDGASRPWLLHARYAEGSVAFLLQRLGSGKRPHEVARSPAAGYSEIGQFLGFDVQDQRLLAALPVDGPVSSLEVITTSLKLPPEPEPSPKAQDVEGLPKGETDDVFFRLVGVALIIVGALFGIRAYQRGGTRPETMPASDTTDK